MTDADSDMVERVARALARHRLAHNQPDRGKEPLARLHPSKRRECFDAARAAIAAMREPTGHMLEAGYMVGYVPGTPHKMPPAANIWQAMISAALGEIDP